MWAACGETSTAALDQGKLAVKVVCCEASSARLHVIRGFDGRLVCNTASWQCELQEQQPDNKRVQSTSLLNSTLLTWCWNIPIDCMADMLCSILAV